MKTSTETETVLVTLVLKYFEKKTATQTLCRKFYHFHPKVQYQISNTCTLKEGKTCSHFNFQHFENSKFQLKRVRWSTLVQSELNKWVQCGEILNSLYKKFQGSEKMIISIINVLFLYICILQVFSKSKCSSDETKGEIQNPNPNGPWITE